MSSPEGAFLDAITAALLADDAVSEIVGEKVYDEVPGRAEGSASSPPYVYFGPIARRRSEGGCDPLWSITVRIYSASVGFGRREAWNLGAAVAAALEGEDLTLASPYQAVEPLRCTQAGDVIAPPSPKTVYVDVTTLVTQST